MNLPLSLCQQQENRIDKNALIQLDESYCLSLHQGIDEIAPLWDELGEAQSIFLSSSYLRALELAPPKGLEVYYALVWKKEQLIGILYSQVFFLDLQSSVQGEEEQSEGSVCIIKALGKALKHWIRKQVAYELLVSGNILLTGPYGFAFRETLSEAEQSKILRKGQEQLRAELEKRGKKVQIQLYKDYAAREEKDLQEKLVKEEKFYGFRLQPSMLLQLAPSWQNFDDYLAAMSSKYRVRAKRAAKKGSGIEKKELNLEEIGQHKDTIYTLYREVANNVRFNAFELHPDYFYQLKKQLGSAFQLFVYRIEGEIIGFYTAIKNGKELEAHFLGLQGQYNGSHQAYLNILYDLVRLAIDKGAERLNLARTALEIKSSVGAEPEELYCYMRHKGKLSQKLLQLVFDSMNPEEEWQPRHPFKSQES